MIHSHYQQSHYFQKNNTNQGTARVASGLDDFGYLGEIKEWKEPSKTEFGENIGFWESPCGNVQ